MDSIITHAVSLILGVGVGALARDFVRTARQENAFTRRFGEDLDGFLARFRDKTGVPVGVIDPFPEPPPQQRTANLPAPSPAFDGEPDSEPGGEDEHSRDPTRAVCLPVAPPRGDANLSGWHINPPPPVPGRHRIEPDHRTRNLAAAVGQVAPPGVTA